MNERTLAETAEARKRLRPKPPRGVVMTFPDDITFEMEVMDTDHQEDMATNHVTEAIALVAEGGFLEPVAKLYLAYFPSRLKRAVFRSEEEALLWVDEQLNTSLS